MTILKEKGFQGIKLLEIESVGPGWNDGRKLVWKIEDLVKAFGLKWETYYEDEYLIEQCIPSERVTSIWG